MANGKKASGSRSKNNAALVLDGALAATSGGPSSADLPLPHELTGKDPTTAALANQKAGTKAMAASVPFNSMKKFEYGASNAMVPRSGHGDVASDDLVSASTVSEIESNDKLGEGVARVDHSPVSAPLDRARVGDSGQTLTTNMGVKISDNQSSLKAGLRGPTLLEDFILREKITHFDHERIPERIVHARGSGAHGFFECYAPLSPYTKAAPFSEAGKQTPVFVRFSTVAGERGSADAVRDVRGFAVKFYTEEGNWDIVGNNMPVFFIQDAMKFPDLVHAVKPEPHHGMPQAASAHDTFWDFVSLMPESTHMLLWVMSDRAIPRSYGTMQGFGVHTFRLVNDAGESVFCKFHWNPVAGTHSLVWDEAVKINGADADFHRRDLWEAIEAGNGPQWELGMQIFTEHQAEGFSFDILDATKLVPEELVPVMPVGKLTLTRNPDNFFAETEQVAFGTANVIPGIDFSNDPLLAGRHHSYFDTQLSRLGGPNFHEIPINSPIAPVHNNQRDGIHRHGIARGRVAYEPNSLGGGCPFQAGLRGFASFPAPVHEDKVRGKPEKFADHYSQAKLFWNSQSDVEKTHIVGAFRFELTKVQTQPIRERVVAMLRNIAPELADRVCGGLGFPLPDAQPVLFEPDDIEIKASSALSLLARPGDGTVSGLKIALLVADGVDAAPLLKLKDRLVKEKAVVRFLSRSLGRIPSISGPELHAEVTLETAPSVLWDAVIVCGGEKAQTVLSADATVHDFLRQHYQHLKPIVALQSRAVLTAARIDDDHSSVGATTGVHIESEGRTEIILSVLAKRRYFERTVD